MDLLNRKAIVTGSSRGIGAGIAVMFAKEGADIVVNYNKDEAGAQNVAKAVEDSGRKCLIVRADVSQEKEAENLIKKSIDKFGQIDILVNNAGGAAQVPEGSFVDMPMEYWRAQTELNLNAAVYCSHFLLKHMVKQSLRGDIINIGSIHSEVTFSSRKTLPYGPAKAGLDMFTKCLAVEFGQYGINVNCISPGQVLIPSTATKYPQEWWDLLNRRIPLGRPGTPDDIANLAVFLASEKSAYITGQIVVIDGGYLVDGILMV